MEVVIHLQKRKLANGREAYYLRYWDKGKNKCVPVRVVRQDRAFRGVYPFPTKEAGEEFIRTSRAMDDYRRHSNGLKYLKDKKAMADFLEMRDEFIIDIKISSPRSWKSGELYLDKYVFPYFLEVVNEFNINKWHLYFKDYRIWLVENAYKSSVPNNERTGRDLISYSTRNHCIRILNTFLTSMRERGKLIPECEIKCKSFPQHQVNENARGVNDIISELEFERVRRDLRALFNNNELTEEQRGNIQGTIDFFTVLYNTGMRFNELYSLSFNDVFFEEDVEQGLATWIKDELKRYNLKLYGYIVIVSQCEHKTRQREELTGEVKRIPLKGRKTKDLKNGRVIPITNKETMEILTRRYDLAFNSFEQSEHISEKAEDYFIFNESVNSIRRIFNRVFKKGFHACRHSFITNLVGKTNNQILTRAITGHKSISAFERYLHIYEASVQRGIAQTRNHRRRNLRAVGNE